MKLTDWLMPSNKHNFIMTTATALISSLFKALMRFHQSLPLFSFVLYSFLHYCIGDDLRYMHYGFSMRLGKCRASRGTSYVVLTLFFAWNVIKSVLSSLKGSIVINHDTPALIYNWGTCFDDQIYRIFHNGWINCRGVFHVYSNVQCCDITKQTTSLIAQQ